MANLSAFLKTHSSPRSFFIFSYFFIFFCPYFISVLFCSRSRSSSRRRWPTTIVSLFRDFLLRKWNLMLWLNIARARVICLFFPQREEEEEEEDGRWECFYYSFMRRDSSDRRGSLRGFMWCHERKKKKKKKKRKRNKNASAQLSSIHSTHRHTRGGCRCAFHYFITSYWNFFFFFFFFFFVGFVVERKTIRERKNERINIQHTIR